VNRYYNFIYFVVLISIFFFLPQLVRAQSTNAHIIFSDNLQDVNGTGINAHNPLWNCDTNTNVIENNVLLVTHSDWCSPPVVNNGSVEINSTDFYLFYVALRDYNSYLQFNPTYGVVQEYRPAVDGFWHPLASYTAGGTHTYKVEFNEAILTIYIDGNLVYSGADLTGYTGRYAVRFEKNDGFSTSTAKLNSFKVTSYDIPVNIAASISAIVDSDINEGAAYSASGSFSDPDSTSWTATVDYGDGSDTQSLQFNSDKTFLLNHVYKDNQANNTPYTVAVKVTDNQGAFSTLTTHVTVKNVIASVSTINFSVNLIQVNASLSAQTTFTDLGVLDTHTAVWDWGDGTTSNGSVTESNGSGSVSNSHIYTTAGVYPIKLIVTDKDGGVGEQIYQYFSVYNSTPQGLFSAGQKYTSPAGAYIQNTNLSGLVFFGLSYKYQGTIAVGNRQFSLDFNAANLHFNATSISSLVIANGIGTLRGSGTINGSGNYNFFVTGKEIADTIRIQIKDTSNNNNVIYDTQQGASDTSEPTTVITAGAILAH
jgi:PKD repeat protein